MLKELMQTPPRAPRDFKAAVAPNWWHVETIANRLGKNQLGAVLGVFMAQLQLDDAHFEVAELDPDGVDRRAPGPAGRRAVAARALHLFAGTGRFAQRRAAAAFSRLDRSPRAAGRVDSPWFLDEVDEHSRLDRMEQALRACTLWLWLDLRFPAIYGHLDAVTDLRRRLNDGIERQLKGKKPLWRARGRRG